MPAAINSVIAQTYSEWDLIVVAQGANATAGDVVRSIAPDDSRIEVVTIPQRGLSVARNAALQWAEGDAIAMMDDDCEAAPDWLATVASCFEEDPHVGLVGGALRGPSHLGMLTRCPALEPADAVYDPGRDVGPPPGWDWVGANFAIRRSVAERIGPFDEQLGAGSNFMAGEDTDYKLRMEQRGVRMRSTPKSVVHHTSGSRHGLRAVLRFQQGYAVGNGALAGKLTLGGDPRGRQWLARTKRQCMSAAWNVHRWYRSPEPLLRWAYYRSAYMQCVSEYEIDAGGMLRRRGPRREAH